MKNKLIEQLKFIGLNDEQVKELEELGLDAMEHSVRLLSKGRSFESCLRICKKVIKVSESMRKELEPVLKEIKKGNKQELAEDIIEGIRKFIK